MPQENEGEVARREGLPSPGRLASGNLGPGAGLPFSQASLRGTVSPSGSRDGWTEEDKWSCLISTMRQRMKGDDGF